MKLVNDSVILKFRQILFRDKNFLFFRRNLIERERERERETKIQNFQKFYMNCHNIDVDFKDNR